MREWLSAHLAANQGQPTAALQPPDPTVSPAAFKAWFQSCSPNPIQKYSSPYLCTPP